MRTGAGYAENGEGGRKGVAARSGVGFSPTRQCRYRF